MDVRCDRCETEYELDDAIVTDTGASVQCTTCGHTFVVRRNPTGRGGAIALTPPSGGVVDPNGPGPEVPEWTLSTDDGKVHRFRDLNTLQKWIVERKVGRGERISRAGGPWLSLGDVVELTPFFNVVDEADRARASTGLTGGMPTAPTFPSGMDWGTPAPAARSPSGAIRSSAGTPPPVPAEARRPVSEDGPTVPNRRLPGGEPSPPPVAAPKPPIPLPGVRSSQSQPVARASTAASTGRRTPEPRASTSASTGARSGSGAAPASGPISKDALAGKESPGNKETAANKEGLRPIGSAARAAALSELPFGSHITAEAHALESDFARKGHGGRNAVVVLIVLVAAASGGYWWWREQKLHAPASPEAASSGPAVASPASATGVVPSPLVAATNSDKRGNSAASVAGPAGGSAAGSAPAAGGMAAGAGGAPLLAGNAARGRPVTALSPSGRAGRLPGEVSKGPPGAVAAGGASSSSYDRLVTEADRLLEHGKAAKADKLYAQALAARPDGVSALTGAAYVLLDRQRHFKAIETFRRALSIQPTFGPALFGIAESYRARGDSAQALGAYRQYLAISPTGTDAPAARRQIKDLESAGASSPASGDRSSEAPGSGPDP